MSAADPVAEQAGLIERLPFVEGLRGLAAMVVVLGHLIHGTGDFPATGSLFDADFYEALSWPVWPGSEMVDLFIMVSGFSLAYSEDRRRARQASPTTTRQFILRRAWRILPTYYVAFAFGLVVLAVVPNHFLEVHVLAPQGLTAPGVLSHLVLLHNLSTDWQYQGNGPLWSMAYEAQLYLLFGVLFWAMRRWRAPWGALAVAVLAIVLDLGRRRLLPSFELFGLLRWFALGLLVASVYRHDLIRRLPVGGLTAVGVSALLVAYVRFDRLSSNIAHDLLWGTAFTALLLAMALRPRARRNPLSTTPMRWIGLRSYSLYAIHFPVVWALFAALAAFGVANGAPRAAVMVLVGTPLVIATAHVCFRLVERPSLDRVRAVR